MPCLCSRPRCIAEVDGNAPLDIAISIGILPEVDTRIESVALTTFEISPDGERVQLNVRTAAGADAALVLPTLCVNQLLMTLPRIIEDALRKSRNDDSLRLAHPLERFTIELGERRGDEATYILTLHTDREFRVSFAVRPSLLGSIAFSIVEDVLQNSATGIRPELNS
jgi:hypothetical protein